MEGKIKYRDILGYERVAALIDEGHTLEDIKESIKGQSYGVISVAIDEGPSISYRTISEATYQTGLPVSKLARYKNKANVVHPIKINNGGKLYTIRYEGFEDKDDEIKEPKKLGRSTMLLINEKDLVTYRSSSEASRETGISHDLIRYYHDKAYGKNPKQIKSNGNTYKICIDDR